MSNKTISVPEDVLPIIERLEVPFSRWVTAQLRRHAAVTDLSFSQQLIADADLAGADPRPTAEHAVAIGERLEQSAPW